MSGHPFAVLSARVEGATADMTPIADQLEQCLTETPVADLPAFIGALAEVSAKAQLKLMRGPVAVRYQ